METKEQQEFLDRVYAALKFHFTPIWNDEPPFGKIMKIESLSADFKQEPDYFRFYPDGYLTFPRRIKEFVLEHLDDDVYRVRKHLK